MKLFVRLATLALALVMLAGMAAACAQPGDDSSDTTTVSDKSPDHFSDDDIDGDTPYDTDSNGFVLDNLPDDLNYGNAEVSVLHWIAERDEFWSEGITGDNILDSIYYRNLNIEDRLGVTLKFEEFPGNLTNVDRFTEKVESSYKAGERQYDIVAAYSITAGQIAIGGYYADLNYIDDSYIDTDMPWWPTSVTEGLSVGDALYYISGDISTNTLHFMYAIYYNKDLLDRLGLTDPAEYVTDKTWTLDKLIEMSSNQYRDQDGDGKLSEGDCYGFGTIYYGADAFYTGSGLRLVECTDDSDLLKISDDYFSDKTVDLVDKLGKWMVTNDCYICLHEDSHTVEYQVPFVEGRMLFLQDRAYIADNIHPVKLNRVGWKYGIVPTPLYDEGQENYITVVGNPFTLYGIMNDCDDEEKTMLSAVLECWGSEAYRLTSPALFETNMKYKYTKVDTAAQMYDILRETACFDLGRIFYRSLGPSMSDKPSKVMTVNGSWEEEMKDYKNLLGNQLKQIISSFRKIQ